MSLINDQQKMLDIIFAKRNRNYGAYALRSAYGNTLFRSLFIVAFTVFTSVGLASWLKKEHANKHELTGQINDSTAIRIIKVELPEEPEQPKEMANNSKRQTSAPNNNTQSTIINNNAPDTVQQVVNTDITSTNTSTNSSNTGNEGQNNLSGNGKGTETLVATNPLDLFAVDENPEFEGGYNALLSFVRNNLVYPNMAVENNKQGTLYVKFVVNEEGHVSQITLMNNLGYGLDDEAMRVVSKIPKFKSPGKVKGKAVKTYYQLPIKFKLG